jgi:hypothetical protein
MFLPFVVGATDSKGPTNKALTPADVPEACPALPTGQLIAGLATGQVLHSGQEVTLRFSSKVFSCTDWSNDVSFADCRDWWSFNITVPSSCLAPGVYKLADVGTQFGDLINTLHPASEQGCNGGDRCEGRTEGTGAITILDPAATLEIYCVRDGYVTGRLTGLRDPDFPVTPDFNGEFIALTCP